MNVNKIAIYVEPAVIQIKGKKVTAIHHEVYCDKVQASISAEIVPTDFVKDAIAQLVTSLLKQYESDKTSVAIYCSKDNLVWDYKKILSDFNFSTKDGEHLENKCRYNFCKELSKFKDVSIEQNGVLTMSAKDEAKISAIQIAEVYRRCNHQTKQKH